MPLCNFLKGRDLAETRFGHRFSSLLSSQEVELYFGNVAGQVDNGAIYSGESLLNM